MSFGPFLGFGPCGAGAGALLKDFTVLSFSYLQTLMFLVRDFACPYEYDYGAAGGDQLLDKRLQVTISITIHTIYTVEVYLGIFAEEIYIHV